MDTEAVRELEQVEYGQVWDRIEEQFQFRPGMSPSTWPAIREPVPSVTWTLNPLPDPPDYPLLDELTQAVHAALAACTAPGGTVLSLDWQHTSYRVRPHELRSAAWPLGPFPDGDYYSYLAEDFSLGTFGHPWEYSICVFGAPLLDRLTEPLDRILLRRLRVDGQPVSPPS